MEDAVTILVIEDNTIISEYIEIFLQEAGYKVILAGNGNKGLEIIQNTPVNIVITDLVMPGKTGMGTIQDIRRNYPEIKIIAMSGSDNKEEYLKLALLFGAESYVQKPFTPDVMLKEVRKVLAC